MSKTQRFSVVDSLRTEEEIQNYLTEMLKSGASHKAMRKAFMNAEIARAKLEQQEPNYQTVDMFVNALFNAKYHLTTATA